MVLFDFETSYPQRFFPMLTVILDLAIHGLVKPALALVIAFAVCPAASLTIVLYSITCRFTRKVWDSIIFGLVLKPRARIPARDTFFARRYAGPGLASNHFYQISVVQALAAIEASLEVQVLESYRGYIMRLLNQPLSEYEQFFDRLMQVFSCKFIDLNDEDLDCKRIENKTIQALSEYNTIIDERIRTIKLSVPTEILSKIRLNDKDLQVLIDKATQMVKQKYSQVILKYQEKSLSKLFEENGIDKDWSILTRKKLENIFGTGFLQPLESTDNYFHLEINHLDLNKYQSMICDSNLRDDLDSVTVKYDPKSEQVNVTMPKLQNNLFDPTHNYSMTNQTGLSVPMHLPHQIGIISLMINQRSMNKNATVKNVLEWKNILV